MDATSSREQSRWRGSGDSAWDSISNSRVTTSATGARRSTRRGWSTRPRARRAPDGSARRGTRRSGRRRRRCGRSVFDRRLTDDGSRSREPTGRADPQTSRAGGGAEGGPATVREDAPLDFRARACFERLGARCDAGLAFAGPIVPTGATPEDTSSTAAPDSALLTLPILSRSANQANQIPGARLSESPKLEAPDVKLSGLLVAERRDDAVQDQLLLRDRLVASIANLAVGRTSQESCHAL